MTPKEKSEELIDKFKHSESKDGYNDVRDIHAAIRCALIAVDEMIKTVNMCIPYHNPETFVDYWKEVKQELEKL
jgi:pyruvate/oxaloacetate carboxyltransferase